MSNEQKINLGNIEKHFATFKIILKSDIEEFDNVAFKKTMLSGELRDLIESNKNSALNQKQKKRVVTNPEYENIIKSMNSLIEKIDKRIKNANSLIKKVDDQEETNEERIKYPFYENQDTTERLESFKKYYNNSERLESKILNKISNNNITTHNLIKELLKLLKEDFPNEDNKKEFRIKMIDLLNYIITKSENTDVSTKNDKKNKKTIEKVISLPNGIISKPTLQRIKNDFNNYIDKQTSGIDYRYSNYENMVQCINLLTNYDDKIVIPKYIELNDELLEKEFNKETEDLTNNQHIALLLNASNILELIKKDRNTYKEKEKLLCAKIQVGGDDTKSGLDYLLYNSSKIINNLDNLKNESQEKDDDEINCSEIDKNPNKEQLKKSASDVLKKNMFYIIDKIFKKENFDNDELILNVSNSDYKITEDYVNKTNESLLDDELDNDLFIMPNIEKNDDNKSCVNFYNLENNPTIEISIYPSNCSSKEISRNKCAQRKMKMAVYFDYLTSGESYGEENIKANLDALVKNKLRENNTLACSGKKNTLQKGGGLKTLKNLYKRLDNMKTRKRKNS